jgi:hypothetical protein
MFQRLLGFHRLYSRLLLAAAARRVKNGLSNVDHHADVDFAPPRSAKRRIPIDRLRRGHIPALVNNQRYAS